VSGDPNFPAPLMNRIGVDSAQVANIAEAFTTDAHAETVVSKSTAHVDVQYGRHYNIQETIEWDVQAVTQSYQQFNWATDPVQAGDLNILGELEAPVAVYNTAILTRDFIGLGLWSQNMNKVLVPDIRTLINCVNHTNHEAYTSMQLGYTFKEGTLLMIEPEIRPSIDMQSVYNPTPSLSPNYFGAQGFAVKVRFLYKPGTPHTGNGVDTSINTHNLFWRAKMVDGLGGRGGWDQMVVLDPLKTAGNFAPFTPFTSIPEVSNHWLKEASAPNPVQVP